MEMKGAQYDIKKMFLIVNGFVFQEGKNTVISIEQVCINEKEGSVCVLKMFEWIKLKGATSCMN